MMFAVMVGTSAAMTILKIEFLPYTHPPRAMIAAHSRMTTIAASSK